jgi:ornithine cyclodeaminase/alanine dehydrogenase-like protein (mu-crystallin family)
MVLLIRDDDVKTVFTLDDAIEAVEETYRQHGLGLVQDKLRREVQVKGKGLPHVSPGVTSLGQGLACLEEPNVIMLSHFFNFNVVRLKEFPYYRTYHHLIHLIDGNDGKTIAIINSPTAVFWLRTAAAGAVGAKYLAREETPTAGVIGTGAIGRGQLLTLSKVKRIERAFCFSGRKKDEKYAKEMGERLGIDVVASNSSREVVRNSDVLVTATHATKPIVKGEWVKEGTHINTIGADDPQKTELDGATLKKAAKVVIDSERGLMKIGHIANSLREGILRQEDIATIGEVVAGLKPGRENNQEITVFSSEGTNMQTAGVAYKVYLKVKEADLGIETSTLASYFM